MTRSPSENPTGKSCEEYMREADAFMEQRKWAEARTAYEAARDSAKAEIAELGDNDADNKRRAKLEGQLKRLSENDSNYGRIAMADDWNQRLIGLRQWLRSRLAETQDRSATILSLRHDLALSSVPGNLEEKFSGNIKRKVVEVINDIAEKEKLNKDEVADVVFAYLTHVFDVLEREDEEGELKLIDIAMELPDDDMYTGDRRLTRPNNRLAAEERIINRAIGVLEKGGSRRIIEANQEKFKELMKEALVYTGVRKSDEHWQGIADGIMDAVVRGKGQMPPDLNN